MYSITAYGGMIADRGRTGRVRAQFSQSTFHGMPFSPQRLRLSAADRVPALNREGHSTRLTLELMDAHTPLGEIARRLQADFPDLFRGPSDALDRVAELARAWCELPED